MRSGIAILLLALVQCMSYGQSPGSTKSTPKKPPQITTIEGKSLRTWRVLLKDEDPGVRADAVMAIVQFGELAADAVPDLLELVVDARDISPRAKAILALRYIDVHDRDIERIVKCMAERIELGKNHYRRESQAIIRLEALYTLKRFIKDGRPAIEALISSSKDSASFEIRLQAIAVLWRIGAENVSPKQGADPQIIKAMLDAVGRSSNAHKVKIEALFGLAALGRPADPALNARFIKDLCAVAKGPSPVNRTQKSQARQIWALAALTHAGVLPKQEKEAMPRLLKFLKNPSPQTRCQAIAALSTLRKKAVKHIPYLLELLDDKESMVGQAACRALEQIDETSGGVVPRLIEITAHKEPLRAAAAVNALVSLRQNTPKVRAALETLKTSKDTDKYLRFHADQALEKLKKQADEPKTPKNSKDAKKS